MTNQNGQHPSDDPKRTLTNKLSDQLIGNETDIQERKTDEPVPVPKFLKILTDPTISAVVRFIKGFKDDFSSNESLVTRILKSFIRVVISVFLLAILISAFLFIASQGLDQFNKIPERWERLFESASECESKVQELELMIESSESVQCEATTEMPSQVDTESVDSMEVDNLAENQSTNPDSDQETQ